MRTRTHRALTIVAVLAVLVAAVTAQERDRAKIPDQYKWNLADIYPTEAAWRAAKDKLAAELPQLRQYPGQARLVGGDARRRARQAVRVRQGAVAALRLREHARPTRTRATRAHQGMRQEMVQLAATFSRRSGVHRAGDPARRQGARSSGSSPSEPRLKIYRFYLEDIARRAAHTLSDNEEKILADAGPLAGTPVERLRHPRRTPTSRIRRSR